MLNTSFPYTKGDNQGELGDRFDPNDQRGETLQKNTIIFLIYHFPYHTLKLFDLLILEIKFLFFKNTVEILKFR